MENQCEAVDLSKNARRSMFTTKRRRAVRKPPSKIIKKSTNNGDSSRPKRKQVVRDDKIKEIVVYEIIVKKQSKAAMSRKYNIPQSTIRGWVKAALTALKAAKLVLKSFISRVTGSEAPSMIASPPAASETPMNSRAKKDSEMTSPAPSESAVRSAAESETASRSVTPRPSPARPTSESSMDGSNDDDCLNMATCSSPLPDFIPDNPSFMDFSDCSTAMHMSREQEIQRRLFDKSFEDAKEAMTLVIDCDVPLVMRKGLQYLQTFILTMNHIRRIYKNQ